MMAAFHLDNWLFLLLIAIAALFRWLMSAANKASKDSGEDEPRSTSTPPTASPARTVPHAPENSDEERIRKFLEALGQPPGSRPPRPVTQPRPTYRKPVVLSRVGPFESPLPPLTTRPPDLPRKVTLPPDEKKTFKPKTPTATFEVHEAAAIAPSEPPLPIKSPAEAYAIATQPKIVRATGEINIISLLRSPSGLRSAIILREIFGPPRSLQSEPDWRL